MKRLPIYDATAPIACTADSTELPIRIETIERMRVCARSIERIDDGVLLVFPTGAEVEADVRQFADDEKGCCQFWGFEVTTDDDGLTLRWEGPRSVSAFFDDLIERFDSNAPLTPLDGLL